MAEASQFELEGTILRTLPVELSAPFMSPGSLLSRIQLLEWFDLPENDSNIDARVNDLGVDLTAILAFAAGRRIVFANEFPAKYELVPETAFLPTNHMFDGELYGPISFEIKSRLIATVKAIAGLPERQALDLGGSIRTRNAACCLVESDYSTAYGLLIAALETLSRSFGTPTNIWDDWDQAHDWDKFMLGIAVSGKQADAIREKLLLNRQIRLKRTFVDYVVSRLSKEFWKERYFQFTPGFTVNVQGFRPSAGSWQDEGTIDQFVPTKSDELRKRLGKSYDARSEVFHQGARLDIIKLLRLPVNPDLPLSFAGLRRILDHLLWLEITDASKRASDLPDFRIQHPLA